MNVQVQLKWTDGMQFVAQAGEGPAVVMDTRGGKSGPSPMELLLMGVAGCTAVDVIIIMKKKRAKLIDFQINISGQRADEYPRRYTKIHIEYVFFGTGIRPKAVEQAIQLSETKYCSATASLNADVEHSYRIVERES
jgi:putative redox protein